MVISSGSDRNDIGLPIDRGNVGSCVEVLPRYAASLVSGPKMKISRPKARHPFDFARALYIIFRSSLSVISRYIISCVVCRKRPHIKTNPGTLRSDAPWS